MLSLPSGLQTFVTDVKVFSVLQDFQFDFKEAHLTYHRSPEVYWEDETCADWFPSVRS